MAQDRGIGRDRDWSVRPDDHRQPERFQPAVPRLSQRIRLPIIAKIPRGDHPSAKDLAKLRHEFAILRELNHPGVPRAHDLLPYRSGSALIIEDKGFVSLNEVLSERRLPLSTVLRLATEVAEILGYLHRSHVIHKDIKSQNIRSIPSYSRPR